MLDAPIYNEIRKIDSRAISSTPTQGSLADLIKNSGDKPYTNFIDFSTTSTTFVQALSLNGKGKALVIGSAISTAYCKIKITIDGNFFDFSNTSLGGNITQVVNFGEFSFNSSLKVEICTTNANYSAKVAIPYYVE